MNRTLRAVLSWTLVAAVILAVASLIVGNRSERQVIVVNPLEMGVKIHFGDRLVTIGPTIHASVTIPVGGQDVVVEDQDGRVVDRHYLRVPSGGGQAIYAVLGAAPLYRENITYGDTSDASSSEPPVDAGFTPLLGERFQVVQANYVFQDPPRQIEMPSGSGRVVKSHVAEASGGWKAALSMSSETASLAATTAMARRLHRALPADPYPMGFLFLSASIEEGPESALVLAEEALRDAPDSPDAYRLYSQAMRVAGRLGALRKEYRARAAQVPHRPLATAMLIRVLPRAEAQETARAAVAEFPGDPEVLLTAAYVTLRAGQADDAAALYARIPAGPARDPDSHVRALLAAGRRQEALAVALAAARAKGAGPEDVARYIRVARPALQTGMKVEVAPDQLVRDWAGQDGQASESWVKSLLGELMPGNYGDLAIPSYLRAELDLAAWSTRDPSRALEKCRDGSETLPLRLSFDITTLLALEAYRVGDRPVFRRLQFRVPVAEAELAAWIDRGVEPEEAWRFDDNERAAFALVRERALLSTGVPVSPALAAAARSDPLGGPAQMAAATWPKPARSARKVQLVLEP